MQAITEGLICISYKSITFYNSKYSLSKIEGDYQDDEMMESVCMQMDTNGSMYVFIMEYFRCYIF